MRAAVPRCWSASHVRHPPTADHLVPHSHEIATTGLRVRVIDLPTLIEIKRSTGRVRDALVVPLLLALQARASNR